MNWEAIRKEYKTTNITLKALAEKYGVKLGTLKSRKSREGWLRVASKKDATKSKRVANKKVADAPVKPIIESDALTEKQKLFCLYYIKYYNATKAYQKAYECSYATANAEGYKHLVKPCIKNELERLKAERQTSVFLDAQAILQEYIDIAFADITDYLSFGKKEIEIDKDEEGNPITAKVNYVDIKDSHEIDGSLVSEIKQSREGISIKLHDKLKALEKLEKYFDLLPDHHKRKLEEEKSNLDKQKFDLDKRIVELREREEEKKGW